MQEAADGDSIATVIGDVNENTLASPLEDTLQLVGEYRSTCADVVSRAHRRRFAALLAASSRLKDLEGLAACHFERRLTEGALDTADGPSDLMQIKCPNNRAHCPDRPADAAAPCPSRRSTLARSRLTVLSRR